MGWLDAFTNSSGGTNWGAIVGGALAAGTTIYAANQQKKMQQEQYKQQQNLYNEQIQYQQDQIAAARSTPMAQLAPILMESLINAYSGKLSKFGINLPVEEMLGAIGRGHPSGDAMSAMLGGGLQATMSPEQAYGMGGFKGYRKAEQTDFMDAQIEQARQALNGFSDGTGRMIKNPWVGDTSIQDSIWNQEVGQNPYSSGMQGVGATPAGNVGMSDQGYLMSVPNQGGVTITARDSKWDRFKDALRNVGNWYDSLDERGGDGALGWLQNQGGNVLQGQIAGLFNLPGQAVGAWLDSNPAALQLDRYSNPYAALSFMLNDPNNRAYLDSFSGPLFGGQSFAAGYDPSIFGYYPQ